jgi:hypothetical protein
MDFYQIMYIVIKEQPTFPELWEELRNPTTPLSAHFTCKPYYCFTFPLPTPCWPYEQYISEGPAELHTETSRRRQNSTAGGTI